MADLRLIALAVALAACGSAGAQPDQASGITPPVGWQRLEPAETAAKLAAAAPNVTVAGVQAWGEPALGCYALWLSLRGSGGDAESIARDVISGLTEAKFTIVDKPVADGLLEVAIERAPYKGQLRARVGDGQLTGLACVANQRDPAACEGGCKAMLGAIP
jgi:hypothetical protein